MDTNKLELEFESNGEIVEVGKGKPFRLLNIEGIENTENELFITPNAMGDGGSVGNLRVAHRPIMAEVEYVKGNKESERKRLISFFNIHEAGSLTVGYGGRRHKIDYIPQSFRSNIKNVRNPLKFLVDLYCPEPYFKDLSAQKSEIAIWRPSFEFPLDIKSEGIEMGFREPSLIVNILNEGDVSTGVKIVFKANATVVNPSLFNVNTREYFKIEKTLVAGDQVIVTTSFQNKKVKFIQNGITSTLHEWDYQSTFLQLEQGDNLFRYDADDGLDNLSVDVYYTQKYLGV